MNIFSFSVALPEPPLPQDVPLASRRTPPWISHHSLRSVYLRKNKHCLSLVLESVSSHRLAQWMKDFLGKPFKH